MNIKPKPVLIKISSVLMLIVPLRTYAALTLPPLFLFTILYMFGVGWREKRGSEQQ